MTVLKINVFAMIYPLTPCVNWMTAEYEAVMNSLKV